jgi:hypothetical protein
MCADQSWPSTWGREAKIAAALARNSPAQICYGNPRRSGEMLGKLPLGEGSPTRLRVLVLAAGVLCLASGFAQELFLAFVSGNKLLEACTPVQLPFCYAYVEGVVDALQSRLAHCTCNNMLCFVYRRGPLRGSLQT